MWIRYKTLEGFIAREATANGRADALAKQVQAQQSTMDWMTLRLTQLEHERAQLIFNYMGVKITTPEIQPAHDSRGAVGAALLHDLPSFDDMGDEEAKRLGLDWNSEGRVVQNGKAIS